jgi:tRNA(Arg) A34 adenosine deaminase TadA
MQKVYNMQLNLPLHQEFVSLKYKSGSDQDMANKRHHILAKCYDKRGRLLSAAFNSYTKTHPLQAYFAKRVGHPECTYLHAEIHAILKCKGKAIYRISIERYHKSGLPANAAPCPICQEAIKAFNIQIVEYTS